jgi:hypothetical protein
MGAPDSSAGSGPSTTTLTVKISTAAREVGTIQ